LAEGCSSIILYQRFGEGGERNNYYKIRLNNKRKNIYSNACT